MSAACAGGNRQPCASTGRYPTREATIPLYQQELDSGEHECEGVRLRHYNLLGLNGALTLPPSAAARPSKLVQVKGEN